MSIPTCNLAIINVKYYFKILIIVKRLFFFYGSRIVILISITVNIIT